MAVVVAVVVVCEGAEVGEGESGCLGGGASKDCPEWSAARMETGIVEDRYGGGDKVEEEV